MDDRHDADKANQLMFQQIESIYAELRRPAVVIDEVEFRADPQECEVIIRFRMKRDEDRPEAQAANPRQTPKLVPVKRSEEGYLRQAANGQFTFTLPGGPSWFFEPPPFGIGPEYFGPKILAHLTFWERPGWVGAYEKITLNAVETLVPPRNND